MYKPLFKTTMLKITLLASISATTVLSGCTPLKDLKEPDKNAAISDKYNVDSMAKDWREQVRKNPRNPYEEFNLPADNDSDYRAPKKIKKNKPLPIDNEDSNYGKFPRYNPDDDNTYLAPEDYPLYMYNN